jgi:hypothetical protein
MDQQLPAEDIPGFGLTRSRTSAENLASLRGSQIDEGRDDN